MKSSRIVVVEDDRLVARDLHEMLEGIGHRVVAVTHSATAAVEAARSDSPDLVLLDIRMLREEDGADAGRTIRRDLDVPVIFLTAHSDPRTMERAQATDPAGYLVKPVDA